VTWTPSLPPRDSVHDDERAIYDRLVREQTLTAWAPLVAKFLHPEVRDAFPDDRLQPYFGALMNSPLVSAGIGNLAQVYRTRGEFSDGMRHADREWVGMVLCDELDLFWVAYVHAPDAVATGVRPEAMLAIFEGRPGDLTADESEKDAFVRAVINGSMIEARYKSMERLVGVRAAVEITCLTGFLIKTIRQMQAFGVPDTTRGHLIEWLRAFVDGRIAPTDARSRIASAEAAAAAVSA
jgi:hypothetical protein